MLLGSTNLRGHRTIRSFFGSHGLAVLALAVLLQIPADAQSRSVVKVGPSFKTAAADSPSTAAGANRDAIDPLKIKKLVKKADRLKSAKKYTEALSAYLQALALLVELGRSTGEAILQRRIALTYDYLNQPDKALEWYQRSLADYRVLDKPAGEATVLTDIGLVYRNLGNYSAALEALKKALTLRRSLDDPKGAARVLINMGVIHFDQSRYAHAIESYEAALAMLESLDDRSPTELGKTLNNLALNYTELGQYPKALVLYRRALPLIEQAGDPAATATTLHNIGFAHAKAEAPSEALQYYQRALMVRERIADENGMASTLNNMGFLISKQGDINGAMKLFDQALALARKNNDFSIEGRILDSEGDSYAQAGRFTDALAAYHEALAIRRQRGDRRGERVTLANIGRVLERQGNDALAIVFFKQAVNVSETIRGDLAGLSHDLQTSYSRKVSEIYRRLADLLLKYDRVAEAQQVLDLLKLQELEEFSLEVRGSPQTRRGIRELAGEKRLARRHDEIFSHFVETLKVLSGLAMRPDKLTQSQRDQLKALTSEKKQFSRIFNQFVKSKEVRSWNQSMSEGSLKITQIMNIQDNLGKLNNTVLLYPLILDDRLELVLVTAYAPPVHRVVEIKGTALNDVINRFRKKLTDVGSDPMPLARQLYDVLIQPLSGALDAAGAQTIIYAPDRALRYVPLSALYDGQKWLVERFNIYRITAFSLTDLNIKPHQDLRVFAAAFSSGDFAFKAGGQNFHFAGLPFARLEIAGLKKTIPNTQTLFDGDFTPQAIEQEAGFHTVVHLATHAAFLTGHPDESFILFGNGERLTLLDVENDWAGILPEVELVVLSACETGIDGQLDNGNEILGFGALMERAGADASIATLWSVDDGGTQVVMDAFYKLLYEGHVTKAVALQQAQRLLIRNGDLSASSTRGVVSADTGNRLKGRLGHPYYWAPFILIGNGL